MIQKKFGRFIEATVTRIVDDDGIEYNIQDNTDEKAEVYLLGLIAKGLRGVQLLLLMSVFAVLLMFGFVGVESEDLLFFLFVLAAPPAVAGILELPRQLILLAIDRMND